MSDVVEQIKHINQRLQALIVQSNQQDQWESIAKEYGVLQAGLFELDMASAASNPELGPQLELLQQSNAALLSIVSKERKGAMTGSKTLKRQQKASNAYQKGY